MNPKQASGGRIVPTAGTHIGWGMHGCSHVLRQDLRLPSACTSAGVFGTTNVAVAGVDPGRHFRTHGNALQLLRAGRAGKPNPNPAGTGLVRVLNRTRPCLPQRWSLVLGDAMGCSGHRQPTLYIRAFPFQLQAGYNAGD